MPFPARSVGQTLETQTRRLTARSILAYAAGLGAGEAEFLDDAQPGGLRALPFQCVSLEWPGLVSLRGALPGLQPTEAMRGVHAIQDSTFHRPMRPGDHLETKGQLVSARTIRAGVLTVIRLETRDRATREPVVTSWSSSIYRDVGLDGEDTVIASAPEPTSSAPAPFLEDAETVVVPIAREAPHVYSECADIWNPIHTEREVALAAGLPDIILHGTATWALAGLEILRHYSGRDVSRLKRISGRFSGMVIPGEAIEIRHAAVAQNLVRFEVLNGSGATAIRDGFAVLND